MLYVMNLDFRCIRLISPLLLQVSTLAEKLRQPPYALSTIVLSIDDLYLTHHLQSELAASHPSNPLIQHRGQPSTHDLPLALSLLSDLQQGKVTRIPSYDKSAHSGQGDRVAKEQWAEVNRDRRQKTEVVIFEGWCVGFRALPRETLVRQWEGAAREREKGGYVGRLGWNRLEDVDFVNEALRNYDQLTDQLDALIHLDAEDPMFVYEWRCQSERRLRENEGSGMTDDQVINFVNGCTLSPPQILAATDRNRLPGIRALYEQPEGRCLR